MNDVIKFGKKLFSASVVGVTIAWSMGLAAFVPVAAQAATCPELEAGDLFKATGASAVYYLTASMERAYFPHVDVFNSWNLSFNDVVTVSGECLFAYPAATVAGINYRPGSRLVKLSDASPVFAVTPGNKLVQVTGESAAALYGTNWTSVLRDVSPFHWASYTDTRTTWSESKPHDGQFVKKTGETTVYWVKDGMLHQVDGSNVPDVRTVSAATFATLSVASGSVTVSSAYANPTQIDGEAPGATTGDLTVSLASDTPAGTTVPVGAEADLLKVNLRAGTGAASVKSLTVTRSAFTAAAALDNVGVYVNGVRQGTVKSSWTSDRKMTFNFSTPIDISANSQASIMVRGRVASSTSSYAAVSIATASDVVTESSAVKGSFPITGNLMSVAGGITAGALTLENAADNNNAAAAFGSDDVSLASFDLSATSGGSDSDEDVLLTTITFENGGTAPSNAVSNLRLLVDGQQVATGVVSGDFVTFNFSAVLIEKGSSVSVEFLGDLENGEEDDTVQFFVYDIVAMGKELGFRASAAFTDLDRKTDTGVNDITLAAGDVTMDFNKTLSPSTEVRPNTDNVVLATLELTSNDEDVTISSITHTDSSAPFQITGTGLTTGEISNVQLKEVGGGSYDVTATFDTDHWELVIDDEIFLPRAVKKVFQVVVDLEDSIDDGDSLSVTLDADAIEHEGEISGSTDLSFTPNSITSAITNVETASLQIGASTLTDVKVVPNTKDVVVYQGTLKAGNASALKVTSLKVSTRDTGTDNEDSLFSDTNISQLRLYVGGTLVKSSSNSITEGADGGTGTVTFSALDISIPAGQTVTVSLQADFASSLSGTGEFALNVSAVGDVVARTATGVVETLEAGQKTFVGSSATTESREVTLATVGTLAVDMVTSDSKSNRDLYVLAGGSTPADRYIGELEFSATNEDILVEELTFWADGNATIADIASLSLVKGDGTVVKTQVFEGTTTTFENLNYTVEEGALDSLYVKVNAQGTNVANNPASTATPGVTTSLKIIGVEAKGVDTQTDLSMAAGLDGSPVGETNKWDETDASKTATVMAVVVTNVISSMANTSLQGGVNKAIGEYLVTIDRGSNRNTNNAAYPLTLGQLVLSFSTSTALSVSNVQVYVKGDSSDKTTAVAVSSGTATVNLTTLTGSNEEITADSVTLVVEGDVALTGTGTEYLQTSIANLGTAFTWDGGATNGGNSLLTITEVTGAYLSLSN
ncbi:MAG: hypothetical protein KBD29_01175 [Candidatus Magasanikbacteria bacterium]|nr:hypothetical protein [Candidatus Magasanikbacteria bacterium]